MNINPLLSSICDDEKLMKNVSLPRVSHGGSQPLTLEEYEAIKVVLKFNVTLHGLWTVYSYHYDGDSLGNTLQHQESMSTQLVAIEMTD